MNNVFKLIFTFAIAVFSSCGAHDWKMIAEAFPKSDLTHLIGPSHANPQPSDPVWENLTDVPVCISVHLNSASQGNYKAAFRRSLGFNSWVALVYLIEPGEASSSLEYHMVAYDTVRGIMSTDLNLTVSYGDGDFNFIESWFADLDNDGTLEIVHRFLSYELPKPEDIPPYPGWIPNWETWVSEFADSVYVRSDRKFVLDTIGTFQMGAEKEMRKEFLSAGYPEMLPPWLR